MATSSGRRPAAKAAEAAKVAAKITPLIPTELTKTCRWENRTKANSLEGTLVVSAPGGPCEMRTLFDTGSEADAAGYEKAAELKQQGVSWGDSGGNIGCC